MMKQLLTSLAAASVLLIGAAASAEERPGNRAGSEPQSARLQAQYLRNNNPPASVPGDRYCVEPTGFGLTFREQHPYNNNPYSGTPSNTSPGQQRMQPSSAGRGPSPSPGGYR